MTIHDVQRILDATMLCAGESMDREVHTACGSDMMSDVLAYVKEQGVLLTGLVNPQVIRTAEMMDIICVAFVRGKMPDEAMVKLAEDRGITMLTTKLRMFTACGKLYQSGLDGGV